MLCLQAKSDLEVKLAELEKYRDQMSQQQAVKEEIEAFSTEELTKVKQLVRVNHWICVCIEHWLYVCVMTVDNVICLPRVRLVIEWSSACMFVSALLQLKGIGKLYKLVAF